MHNEEREILKRESVLARRAARDSIGQLGLAAREALRPSYLIRKHPWAVAGVATTAAGLGALVVWRIVRRGNRPPAAQHVSAAGNESAAVESPRSPGLLREIGGTLRSILIANVISAVLATVAVGSQADHEINTDDEAPGV